MNLILSKRLETIALNIEKHSTFADIGSDHAYLPCYVCLGDASIHAVAGEVQEGPYQNAIQTVEKFGLSSQVSVRLGNGLSVIEPQDKVDTIVIAGMGGQLVVNILDRRLADLGSVGTVIVQPNTNAPLVREFLYQAGYHLDKEQLVEENGIIYEVLVAKKNSLDPYGGSIAIRQQQFYFGPFLMEEKSALFRKKWQQSYQKLKYITDQMKKAKNTDENKLEDFQVKMDWIEEVFS